MTGDGGKRFNACWRYFNPPRRLAGATFDSYIAKTKQQQEALKTCLGYTTDDITCGRGLFLYGPCGTGKTHLSIALVRRLMEAETERFGARLTEGDTRIWVYGDNYEEYKGIMCSYFAVVELLDALRPGNDAKKERGERLLRRAKYDDVVILDDIGAEKSTEWVEERLYTIIDSRYRQELATIITTNCTEKELQDRLGVRIVSRIYEMTEQVPVIGPDYRRRMA